MADTVARFFLVNPVTTGFTITDPFNSPRPYANGRHEGIDLRANFCLLYTSDAADERSSVDLGGRRIIKKKNHQLSLYTSASTTNDVSMNREASRLTTTNTSRKQTHKEK